MTNTRTFLASFLAFTLAIILPFPAQADTINAKDMKTVLDAPDGMEFTSCSNAKKLSSYTEKNIGISRKEGPGTIMPTNGSTFLQMEGSGTKGKDARSARVKSTFSIKIAGAGVLTFDHRVSTWGGWNDDSLVFYEGDIDDEDSELLKLGGDYWDKYSTEGLISGYDVYETTFWDDAAVYLDTDRYFHTISVALLAPGGEDYEKPDDEDADLLYKAWLDNFTWVPSSDVVCDFLPGSGSTFVGDSMTAYLDTDYYETVVFYYTTDGSTPSSKSTRYNDDNGIEITKNTVLKVAAYENGTLISDAFFAEYTQRPAPEAPVCTVAAQEPSGNATAYFGVQGNTQQLEFYYTLDGTDPTAESASGKSCELSAPCTLKVCASDEGVLGKISTYTVKYSPTPAMLFFSGMTPSENYIFDTFGYTTLRTQSGSAYYTLNGSNAVDYDNDGIWIEKTSDLVYWACVDYTQEQLTDGSEILLNSEKATQTLTQAPEGESSWVTDQITSDGWNLVGMTHNFSVETAIDLAKLLETYAYDSEKNTYLRVGIVEPGKAYWVYGNDHGIPEKIHYIDEAVTPAQVEDKWDMTSGEADYTYEKGVFRPTKDGENAPGWKKVE